MNQRATLGLCTLGQRRPEYLNDWHRNFLKQFGLDVEVIAEHALEGLTAEEIKEIEQKPGDHFIGVTFRDPGGREEEKPGFPAPWIGPGWRAIAVARHLLIPYLQKSIDRLEEKGADVVIITCAEEYPEGALTSKKFLIMPAKCFLGWVRAVLGQTKKARLGVLCASPGHAIQDRATLQRERGLDVYYEILHGDDWESAARRLKEYGVQATLLWGYHSGINHQAENAGAAIVQRITGAPCATPHGLAMRFAAEILSGPEFS
jgi:hypothetical protein